MSQSSTRGNSGKRQVMCVTPSVEFNFLVYATYACSPSHDPAGSMQYVHAVCLTLLASFFLPSHLSFKNMYMHVYCLYIRVCVHVVCIHVVDAIQKVEKIKQRRQDRFVKNRWAGSDALIT